MRLSDMSKATTSAPNVLFYSPDIYALQYGLKAEGFAGHEAFGAMAFAGAGFHDAVYGLRRVSSDRGFEWWLNGVSAHHDAPANTGDGRIGNDLSTDVGIAGHNLHTGLIYRASYGFERGTAVTSARQATKTEDFIDVQRSTSRRRADCRRRRGGRRARDLPPSAGSLPRLPEHAGERHLLFRFQFPPLRVSRRQSIHRRYVGLPRPARQDLSDIGPPSQRTVDRIDDQGDTEPKKHQRPIAVRGREQRLQRQRRAACGENVD